MLNPTSINGCHLVNPFDGVIGRRFKCVRCKRDLPEDSFFPLTRALARKRGRFGSALVLNGVCIKCRKQQRGQWVKHPLYSPSLDRFWEKYYSALKGSAKVRGIFVGVDKDDLLGLYLKAEGRCALSGLQTDFRKKGHAKRGYRANSRPSIDRIDSLKDYTPDNIQLVLDVVNRMKGEMPQDMFVALCQQIAAQNLSL